MSDVLIRPFGHGRVIPLPPQSIFPVPRTEPRTRSRAADVLLVLGCALGLRLLFAALIGGTYDPDEFVILSLSHDLSQGAMPYTHFMFFHPPGSLTIFAALQPVVSLWWPAGRLFVVLLDSVTAICVWRIGSAIFPRRVALVAGLLYAVSPLALVCGVRVGPDPIITALGMAGLTILFARRSPYAAVAAGICLGLAIWVKYPAVLYVPIYVLADRQRARVTMLSCLAAVCIAFAPFVLNLRSFFDQTVVWQLAHRNPTQPIARVAAVAVYLFLLHPLALWGFFRERCPGWLQIGFAVGGAFILTSQVYYHYLLPIVPFAALLAAPRAASLLERSPRLIASGLAILVLVWAQDIDVGSGLSRLYVASYSFADIDQTVDLLQRTTAPGARLLTDQFQYTYLAGRIPVHYFWSMRDVVGTRALERELAGAAAVVLTRHIAATYPPGFVEYLRLRHFHHLRTGATDIWLLNPQVARSSDQGDDDE